MVQGDRQTGKFSTVAADGSEHEVIEWTKYIDVTTRGSESREFVPGLKTLTLRDGQHVNRLGDDEYEVVASGLRLRKAK